MKENAENPAGLDRLVHEPARLIILTALSELESADFLFLLRLAGLTKGNLSSHLDKLEAAGLVEVEKRFVGKKTNTLIRITGSGRAAVEEHWRRLDDLRHRSLQGNPRP
ncbi:ArsR family transcriptional regulator [Rubrobacter marinus]|uniref:ArsR family transcriptional regulator n=1 Tax=Rubrobacter marinus TaxID=2653852 RepID=A0A6G8Q1E6_9ACTN|nr:transcriptional regulator [Rubrobacter marinus]QIN80304.1 ArsR family transcriptional regulator [Rubrobacter marinus]